MAQRNYRDYLVEKPIYEASGKTQLQDPAVTYVDETLVPGTSAVVKMGWVYEIPNPNPPVHEHVHDYDEILLHTGNDPQHPHELGAVIEFVMDGQTILIEKTSAIFIPKGVPHGPLTWKTVTRPHLQMVIKRTGGASSGSSKRQEK